ILGLLWLCIMLPHLWPSPPGGTPKPPTQSLQPKRRRSSEPTPFAGLTHKPPCPLCEHETADITPAPPRRPGPIPPTTCRPRTVETSRTVCPHTDGDDRGWLGLHTLWANGHLRGGSWRLWHCLGGNGYVPEHHGTLCPGKQVAVERLVRVLAC